MALVAGVLLLATIGAGLARRRIQAGKVLLAFLAFLATVVLKRPKRQKTLFGAGFAALRKEALSSLDRC